MIFFIKMILLTTGVAVWGLILIFVSGFAIHWLKTIWSEAIGDNHEKRL